MKIKIANLLVLALVLLFCNACQKENIRPAIVPGVVVKPKEEIKPVSVPEKKHVLKIIGAVEPIYFLPMKSPFNARIDTGAETSSVDVANREMFERDGEKWVAFELINRDNGQKQRFEKKIFRQVTIRRAGEHEDRVIVLMDVKFGGKIIKAQFSLADREKFDYQALVGRNILTGRAIVDTSISNTLR